MHGQPCFLNFSLVAELIGKHGIFDQLLRDGGTALLGIGYEVVDERADDTFDVNAVVGVKTGVLYGDEGIAQVFGHQGNIDHDAVFRAFVIRDDIALRIIQERSLVLRVQQGQVKCGRGFHVTLGNTQNRTAKRQPAQYDHQRKNTHGIDQYGEDKIGFFQARFEYAPFLWSFLFRKSRLCFRHFLLPFLLRIVFVYFGLIQWIPSYKESLHSKRTTYHHIL